MNSAALDVEARLEALRTSLLDRAVPGLDDARERLSKLEAGRRRGRPVQLAVFVLSVAVAITALVSYGYRQPQQSPVEENHESALSRQIDQFAKRAATRDGDSNIAEVRWVASNARTANALLGSMVDSNAPVFLVEIPGSFADVRTFGGPEPSTTCPTPMNYKIAVFVVLRYNFEVVVSTLKQSFDDMNKLGDVHVDRLRDGPLFASPSKTGAAGSENKTGQCVSDRSIEDFVSLAEQGADTTFNASYRIPAQLGAPASTITVAHRAPIGSTSPTSGTWMFELMRTATGAAEIWVSGPGDNNQCVRGSFASSWSCEHTDLNWPQGNGWLLATSDYLPRTELGAIQAIEQNVAPGSISTKRSVVARTPVECLTGVESNRSVTLEWCLTSSGVLAYFSALPEQHGPEFGGSPATGTLTAFSSTAPASLFQLPATPGAWVGAYAGPGAPGN
jgi:hypothetical protein